MIESYKRFVLWNCRILQYIPGFRAYGRFLERQYTKRFWTMFGGNYALSLVCYAWFMHWVKKNSAALPVVEPFDSDQIMRDVAASQTTPDLAKYAREQENIAARSGYDFSNWLIPPTAEVMVITHEDVPDWPETDMDHITRAMADDAAERDQERWDRFAQAQIQDYEDRGRFMS